MRSDLFDLMMIILMAVLAMVLVYLNFFENYSGFVMIPFLAIYYAGRYAGRKFAKPEKR